MEKYDYLIVGSGLFGATFAYLASQGGQKCLVIDKRPHLGGNIYCENIGGINVHKYGAHIFHTSEKKIWNFVNSLVPFNNYINSPVAKAPDGRLYNLPFNMNTFYQIWGVTTPAQAMAKLYEQRREAIEQMRIEGVAKPRNLEEQALCLIGKDIYELLIRHYTEKQWGRPCTELPAFIIRRLPVRMIYDNNYFNDTYQGIPIGGYNILIDKLLEKCDIRLNQDFNEIKHCWRETAKKLVYTGALDEYFDFKLGRLQWRTIRFEVKDLDIPNYQGNAVINYTDAETPWTRIIEHKHFEKFGEDVYAENHTVISREFSAEFITGKEPYYPVNNIQNNQLAEQYRQMSQSEEDVIFGGRLAEYKYYDMAPIIARAFNLFAERGA